MFPNDASVARLVTAVVVETHDDGAVSELRYLSEESMALSDQPDEVTTATDTRELPGANLGREDQGHPYFYQSIGRDRR